MIKARKSVSRPTRLNINIGAVGNDEKYCLCRNSSQKTTFPNHLPLTSRLSLSSNAHLYGLPAELIMEILDLLRPQDLLNFALVHYSLLWSHRIVPAISIGMVNELLAEQQTPNMFNSCPLPNELVEQLLGYLDKQDIIRLMLAYYPTFRSQRYAPDLSSQMLGELIYAASFN